MTLLERAAQFISGIVLIIIGFTILNTVWATYQPESMLYKESEDIEKVKTKPKVVKASWYGKPFHNRITASGERYNMYALTAAHNRLPFGTIVRVTNVKNGKSVKVRINDTGGFHKYGRSIDLSKAANERIKCGLCTVKVEVLKRGDGKYRRS